MTGTMTRLLTALAVCAVTLAPAPARAAVDWMADTDWHGRFGIGHCHVDDSTDLGRLDFDITHLYYRLVAERLAGHEDVAVRLDGRYRSVSGDYTYNSDTPDNRVLMANVNIRNLPGGFEATLGRTFIQEFVSQSVDGLDLKWWYDKTMGLGLFGGFRANPYNDKFNTEFTTSGGYAFYRNDVVSTTAGYALDQYNGEKDRERANASFSFLPAMQQLHVQASVDLDNDFDTHANEGGQTGWEVTNLLLHTNFRLAEVASVSLTYTQFRALNREASYEHYYIDELAFSEETYTVSRARVELRPVKGLAIYGGLDQRNREWDGLNAAQYYAGLRSPDFFGAHWDVRYAQMEWFTGDVTYWYALLGWSGDQLNIEGSAMQLTHTEKNLPNDMNQMVYELSADWWFTKKLYGVLSWSYSAEEFLDVDSVYTSRYADNFTTGTLYAQIGYRF